MSDSETSLSPAKRALLELRRTRSRLDELETAAREPIAIVGLGLRFPGGAVDPDSFWRLLRDGVDGITEIPLSRWSLDEVFDQDPDAPGRMYTRHGGFLEDVDRFDASFFGISRREAETMDPQQRVVMEVAWQALEHAGQDPLALAGTDTGVFMAMSNSDYSRMVFNDPDAIDVYSSTGTNFSVASGRLSFFLGLCGPSIVVDTACSGSLVSIHLASQSLRGRECRMALAGGVNLILTPELNINFCKARMMAAHGRCRTFDAGAEGYIRGEGCGVVVLKRLTDARADGDRVLAVLRGSAVNQDGRSGGLTVPSGPQQESVIRAALNRAGLTPYDIDYLEAHGTGTSLGDPIEAHALRAVFGQGRSKDIPLVVGSVKTNIGHLESAAGVAGLIKVVLSMQHEWLPAHLHFEQLNPHIDWQGMPVEIPVAGKPWRRGSRARLAGVSSFGFSGTNAHVIIAEAPPEGEGGQLAPPRPVHVLTVSGATETARASMTSRYRAQIEANPAQTAEICSAANGGRASLVHRTAYLAFSADDLLAAVVQDQAFARGTATDRAHVAFLFTGQGAQFVGMGKQLYEMEPVFRDAIDKCASLLEAHVDVPLTTLLWGKDAARFEADTRYTQPALFALQWGLVELWRSWGVQPSVVLGHSVGEYAAACVAGVFGLSDGLAFMSARGRLTGGLPHDVGRMAVVLAPRAAVEQAVATRGGRLVIAAFNGPENVTIAGEAADVEAIAQHFEARGNRVERLRVSHAFHSPMMAPVELALAAEAGTRTLVMPAVDVVSTVTGDLASTDITQPEYWQRQLRRPVQFERALSTLAAQGCTAFVEIGPGSTLVGLGQPLIGQAGQVWAPSIRRSRADVEQTAETLALLWTCGVPVNWRAYEGCRGRCRVAVPAYAFERERYWLSRPQVAAVSDESVWAAIREAGSRQSTLGRLDLDIASYPRRWALLDQLTDAYIVRTLFRLGAFVNADERHTLDSLMSSCAIRESYRRLVQRWLQRLVTAGYLRYTGRAYVSISSCALPALEDLRKEADAIFGADRIVLDYVTSCGDQLEAVLTGQTSPLETLFPGGSFDKAEALYEHAPMSAYFAALGRSSLEAIVRTCKGVPLRVLEIGAGTGATTSALAPVLAPGSIYYFTDISDLFLHHGRRKFSAYPHMRYALFDVETGEGDGVLVDGSFDVVVATNALHAVRDLDAALCRVRTLLAPGGCLILNEVTEHLSWFDISTGLIEGWQLFQDRWRTDQPLLRPERWAEALEAAGFDRTITWPSAGSPAEVLAQHVIVSHVPGRWNAKRVTADPHEREPDQAIDSATAMRPNERSHWLETLHAALPETQQEMLIALIRREMASVLRAVSPDTLNITRRLVELGLDSLMAVEFRNRLGQTLGLAEMLPATLVFDYPTIERLAVHLAVDVMGLGGQKQTEIAVPVADRAVEINDMSDEEAELLLLRRLQALQAAP